LRVLGREGDVVDVASRLDLLPKKLEVIVFLLLGGERKEVMRQAVLGIVVQEVVA